MRIAMAADRAGYALKNELRDELRPAGHEVTGFGTQTRRRSTDYPDAARASGRDGGLRRSEIGAFPMLQRRARPCRSSPIRSTVFAPPSELLRKKFGCAVPTMTPMRSPCGERIREFRLGRNGCGSLAAPSTGATGTRSVFLVSADSNG